MCTHLRLGGGRPGCGCCTHPGDGARLHLPMVTWQPKARQQVMVSSFLEEIRRAKVCCREGDDGRHCRWGSQSWGDQRSFPYLMLGHPATASQGVLDRAPLFSPTTGSASGNGCRARRIADGSIGGQCPLMDSRSQPPSIFAEPLSVSEAWKRAGGDQGPSCICWTEAQVASQGCIPACGCNQLLIPGPKG